MRMLIWGLVVSGIMASIIRRDYGLSYFNRAVSMNGTKNNNHFVLSHLRDFKEG